MDIRPISAQREADPSPEEPMVLFFQDLDTLGYSIVPGEEPGTAAVVTPDGACRIRIFDHKFRRDPFGYPLKIRESLRLLGYPTWANRTPRDLAISPTAAFKRRERGGPPSA